MKLTYGITFEDFRSLYPLPDKIRKPKPALYFAIVMGGLLALVGLLIALKALELVSFAGIPEGSIAQGGGVLLFGAAIVVFCLWRERRIDEKTRKQYESALTQKFKTVHCPANRSIECLDDGIETSCSCGVTKRPWTELHAFTEGPHFFQITMRREVHLIPKRAFASDSQATEFRALFGERVQVAPVLSGTRIQFVRTKSDAHSARILHLQKGFTTGQKVNFGLTCLLIIFAGFYLPKFLTGNPNYIAGLGVAVLLLMGTFLPWVKQKKNGYFGPITASFSADGIQIQDTASTAAYRWSDFRGYARNSSYWLLYHRNKTYRAFPRRAFQLNQAAEFNRLLEQNLQPVTSAAR